MIKIYKSFRFFYFKIDKFDNSNNDMI